VGELLERHGFDFVFRAVLLAFLFNNFLVDRLSSKQLIRLAELADPDVAARLSATGLRHLGATLNGLMVMSPEFRYDTARLFLTMFGRSRNIRRELSVDPLSLLEQDARARAGVARLSMILGQ
jgi:hypothetical protein